MIWCPHAADIRLDATAARTLGLGSIAYVHKMSFIRDTLLKVMFGTQFSVKEAII